MNMYLRVTPNVITPENGGGPYLQSIKNILKASDIAYQCIAIESSGLRDMLYEIVVPDATAGDALVRLIQDTHGCVPLSLSDAEICAESFTGIAWGQFGDRIMPQSKIYLLSDLPAWSTVSAAIDGLSTIAEVRAYLKKLSRIVYGLAKGTET